MSTIITKNSSTASAVPSAGSLVQGELAVNVTDKKLYTKDSSATVVKVVGSLGNQEANAVAITGGTVAGVAQTGGTINNTPVGATTASTVRGTTVTATTGFSGDLTGNVTGNTTGTHTGAVTGNVTGNLTGNVTAASGTSTFNHVTISGSLDMDAGTSATITGLATPVNNSDAATKIYVDTAISNLVDGAPANLDTLNEIAAALNDDANLAATLTASIATKVSKAGDSMTGALAMGTNKITGLGTPTAGTDATTKTYVDTADALKLNLAGGTMTGNIVMGANKVTSTATPTADDDLTRKGYVDSILGSATSAAASASAAATSETNAANSASTASTAATNAAASFDSFDDRYLGAKTSAPTVDNDGNTLLTGALYWNSTSNTLWLWSGSAWTQATLSAGSFATLLGTETLTNKTLTAPVLTTPNITTGLTLSGSAGTSGQLLTSAGSGAAPTWSTIDVASNPLTLTASANLTLPTTGASFEKNSRIINLDVDRELVLYSAGNYSSTISAFVYNSSTNTFGAVATIRATAASLGAILIATDRVLVVSVGTGGTSLEAVVLSISTNTITVNTAATATLAGELATTTADFYNGSLVTVGTSFVLSYGRATNVTALRALSVSGTTVTIGSEATLTPATTNAAALFPISSSVVLALSSSSTVFYATPYTVSGSTLTVGTGATTTLSNINYFPVGVFQSGQIGVLFQNSTVFGGVVSVSGTTASISSAQIWSVTASLVMNNNYAAIVGDKMLCYYAATGVTSLVNVLTNTSGTASAGTEIAGGSAVATGQLGYINGNIVNFGLLIPLRYSISGSNAVESVVDTYYAQTATLNMLNNLSSRTWIGNSLRSIYVLRSSTKTMSPFAVNSVYLNSNGTLTPTVAKVFGGTSAFIGNESNVYWSIIARSTTTVTASKVTLS